MAKVSSRSPRFIKSKMGLDHTVHAASVMRALVQSIAERLEDRTGVRARVGQMEQSKTLDGYPKFTVNIKHEAPSELERTKKTKIKHAQDSVRNQLASKHGIQGLLASKGII